MSKRIRALNRQEFEAAASDGAVYGKYLDIDVYVELGVEGNYRESAKDDPNTQYRLFRNCTIFYAASSEDLDAGIFVHETQENVVIVYY